MIGDASLWEIISTNSFTTITGPNLSLALSRILFLFFTLLLFEQSLVEHLECLVAVLKL